MVERSSNRIILYPVHDRSIETLIPIIKKHVEVGSQIFSDGWASYLSLNDEGFKHFNVIHDGKFKQVYEDDEGNEVTAHTNQIEGAWSHAKKHFKNINGTCAKNFESHLCEIIFRNHFSCNIIEAFFGEIKKVFNLESDGRYSYRTPVFSTWKAESDAKIIRSSQQSTTDEDDVIDDASSGNYKPLSQDLEDVVDVVKPLTVTSKLCTVDIKDEPDSLEPIASTSKDSDSVPSKLVSGVELAARPKKTKLRCPDQFYEKGGKANEKRSKTAAKLYTKADFVWLNDLDSDDDFA